MLHKQAKPVFDLLRGFLRGEHESAVARVYLDIDPLGKELAESEDCYQFEIILVPESGVSVHELQSLIPPELSAVAEFSTSLLNYAGVVVQVLHEILMSDAERWVWWDHMDYLSFPEN